MIGSKQQAYTVPKAFLPKSLSGQARDIECIPLSDIDDDVAHSFVHFLYTGKYHTLKPHKTSMEGTPTREHRCSLLTYSAARNHCMDGLASSAKHEIETKSANLPISSVLDNLKSAFSNLRVEDTWLEQYLQRKVKEASDTDEDFLLDPLLADQYRPGFERVLFKSIIKIRRSIDSTLNKDSEDFRQNQVGLGSTKHQQSKDPFNNAFLDEMTSKDTLTKTLRGKESAAEEADATYEQSVLKWVEISHGFKKEYPFTDRSPRLENTASQRGLATTEYDACGKIMDGSSSEDDLDGGFISIPTPTSDNDLEDILQDKDEQETHGLDHPGSGDYPTFPIRETRGAAPTCRWCRRSSDNKRVVTKERSQNFGRPFFICVDCPAPGGKTDEFGNRWMTWDDNVGMNPSNPKCQCEVPSRQDRVIKKSKRLGKGFWTCASGSCDYHSPYLSGQLSLGIGEFDYTYDPEFEPWLLDD